ncbi:MAG: DNA ligase [Cognaticolwellia sp.]
MFQLTTTRCLILSILILLLLPCAIAQESKVHKTKMQKPALQLATKYQKYSVIEHYWVSEKLDGVRGYWTGKELVTRNGNVLSPPTWFIENWPKVVMDGEIWSKRGEFEKISGCIRRKHSDGSCWKSLKLMVFDLPNQPGNFTQRIMIMKQLIQEENLPHLSMVTQLKIANNIDLYALLDNVVTNGGEGLMLHLCRANYQVGRSKNILKLKKHQDAEAVVIAHMPGKGKYQNLLGAIKVKTPQGITFKIGSGFSDQQRKHPPPIGSIITYKYIGKTQRGVPRFASFLRIKNDH